MYAIVKTGGKQYKVCPGDKLNIEKLPAEVGDKVSLQAICVVDGDKVEADPEKAAATPVEAEVIEQFKDKKVIVFKFKKRKNYQRKRGHRQQLTRVLITAVGNDKYVAPKATKKTDKAEKEDAAKNSSAKADAAKKTDTAEAEKKPAAKAAAKSTSKTKAEPKKTTTKAKAEDKPAEKKATAKKSTAKKADEAPADKDEK